MISKSKIIYGSIGAAGAAGTATAVGVNWDKIVNNETVKSIYQTVSGLIFLGNLMSYAEREPQPLPTDLPDYKLLSSETNKKEISKFGGKYGNTLVSDQNNEEWWKWSIKKVKDIENLDGEFSELKDKTESDYEKLRTACTNLYNKENNQVSDNDAKLAWQLCSPFGHRPNNTKDIPKFNYINKFAHSAKEESEHLIADRPSNKNVWLELYKKLMENKTPTPSDDLFSKVKQGYSSKEDENNLSLNKACEKLYSQTEEENKSKLDNLWKYCSLGGQKYEPKNEASQSSKEK